MRLALNFLITAAALGQQVNSFVGGYVPRANLPDVTPDGRPINAWWNPPASSLKPSRTWSDDQLKARAVAKRERKQALRLAEGR